MPGYERPQKNPYPQDFSLTGALPILSPKREAFRKGLFFHYCTSEIVSIRLLMLLVYRLEEAMR